MVRSEREFSQNKIARFAVLKLIIPAISNAFASQKQTPAQSLRDLFTDDYLKRKGLVQKTSQQQAAPYSLTEKGLGALVEMTRRLAA
jgi:hypothetical protein